MDAIEILRSQLSTAQATMEGVLDGLTEEQLNHRPPGATINSIGAVYAHAVSVEDSMIHQVLQQKPTLLEGGWGERLGIPGTRADLLTEVHFSDLAALQEYGAAVMAAADGYLASLGEADLDRSVELRGRPMPAGGVLSRIVTGHALQHAGEMAALKGAMGLKGLPF